MESREAVERLRTAVEKLEQRIRALEERLRRLEGGAPQAEKAPEEREGTFGPVVEHADPSRHRHAVNRALAMLGVVPAAPAAPAAGAGVRHAVEQARRFSGAPPAPPPAPEEPGPEPEEEIVPQPGPEEEIVPLPEVAERPPLPREPHSPAPVDLGEALPVDLVHEARDSRVSAIYLLLPQVILVAGVMAALPGPSGVLASLPIVGLLALPVWGTRTPTLRAHSRFFTIMLLARCLAPDMLLLPHEPPFRNLRFLAMVAASVPALVLVLRRHLGWRLVALLTAAVLGAGVGVERRELASGLVTGAAVLLLSFFSRPRRAPPSGA